MKNGWTCPTWVRTWVAGQPIQATLTDIDHALADVDKALEPAGDAAIIEVIDELGAPDRTDYLRALSGIPKDLLTAAVDRLQHRSRSAPSPSALVRAVAVELQERHRARRTLDLARRLLARGKAVPPRHTRGLPSHQVHHAKHVRAHVETPWWIEKND